MIHFNCFMGGLSQEEEEEKEEKKELSDLDEKQRIEM